MAPICLGIIGLSSTAITSWASAAHLPYLLSPRGRAKYAIAALCNSSVAAAEAAIRAYGLDPSRTRAYGDPRDLAADERVDLVLCCTRVDTHYALVRPSVEAGKAVFVEWPLTHDVEHSRALAGLVAAGGRKEGKLEGAPLRSVVGLQGQLAPIIERLRGFVREGSLGKVLSSEVRAFWGTMDRAAVKEGLSYFADRKVGGNVYMINFAHMFDYVQAVLGEATDLQPRFQLQRPEVTLLDASGAPTGTTVTSDVPDLMLVTGTLSDPRVVAGGGATLSVRFRRGQPFRGESGFTWHINCERGEIRLVSTTGSSLHADVYSRAHNANANAASAPPVSLEVHHHDTDEVRDLDWSWPAWQEEEEVGSDGGGGDGPVGLPFVARSVARLYEAFYAEAVEGGPREYPDFADALRRHEQLHSLLAGWKP